MVFGHFFGIQPNTHGIICTHDHRVTHALNTLHLGNDVDFSIVLYELRIIFSRGVGN